MLSVQLGPFSVPTQLLILYSGIICAWLAGWLIGRKRGSNPESTLFNLLLLGILVARITFVIQYWPQYSLNPFSIIDIRDGGFLPWTGLLAALLLAAYNIWRKPLLRIPLIGGLLAGIIVAGLGFSLLQAMLATQKMPELAFRDINGKPVQLQDYAGKPVVINLWASWCPPCIREMPVLQAAQQAHPDIKFVFINQGEGQQLVSDFLTRYDLSLDNVLLDSGARMGQTVSSLSLPTTLFYDEQAMMQNTHLGELSTASLQHALRSLKPNQEKDSR